jgi:hypothetical protein
LARYRGRRGDNGQADRCGKKAVGNEGTLRVQRDPATMELPKTVPHVEVEADGRRYTVRYQNVLPVVALGWREAGSSAGWRAPASWRVAWSTH